MKWFWKVRLLVINVVQATYISMFETPTSRKNTFVVPKENFSTVESYSKPALKFTLYNRLGHHQSIYNRFFKKFQPHVYKLVSESNYLINQNLNNKKGSKSLIRSMRGKSPTKSVVCRTSYLERIFFVPWFKDLLSLISLLRMQKLWYHLLGKITTSKYIISKTLSKHLCHSFAIFGNTAKVDTKATKEK